MKHPHSPLLLPRRGSRILRPDACRATLPTESGACHFLILPNDTLLAWYDNGDLQIWNVDGLMVRKLEEGTGEPIRTAALVGDQRFCAATDSDIKIYTLLGELICHLSTGDPFRDVHVEEKCIIAVGAKVVSIYSFEGGQEAILKSENDMGYDFGRVYGTDEMILFKTLNRQTVDARRRSFLAGTESGEISVADLFTGDLKRVLASIRTPHKERIHQVILRNERMITLSDDSLRAWAPGPKLLENALPGSIAGRVLPLSNEDYIARYSEGAALFSTRGDVLEVLQTWDFGYLGSLEIVSETKALVAYGDGQVALLALREPFHVDILQDALQPQREGYANVAGETTFLPKSGRIVAYDGDGGIAVWDVSGKPVAERKRYGNRWWAGARELLDSRILLWDHDCVFLILSPEGEIDGSEFDRFRSKEGVMGPVKQVDVFHDGNIAVSINGAVSILEPRGASMAPRAYGHDFGVLDAIELRGGGYLSSGVDDRLIYWDDEAIPRVFFEGHRDCVNGALEMKRGQLVSWGDDGQVALWNRDGKLARPPFFMHDKPIVHTKVLDEDHVIATDGMTLFLLSLSASENPESIQRKHNTEIADILILSSGNVLSWDLDGRMFEWNVFSSECEELSLKGFSLVSAWETRNGGLLILGSPISPRELKSLPEPVRAQTYAQLPLIAIAWSVKDPRRRLSGVLFEAQMKRWMSLGEDQFLAILSNGEAKLLRFDGAALRVVTSVPGTHGAFALADGRPFISVGSGGEVNYRVMSRDAPAEDQRMVAGRSKVELTHNLVLDLKTGAATRVESVGEADAVVGLLEGGWAALYHREGAVKTFNPDGSPRSQHRFFGEAHSFGPRQNGNVGLLTFHKGQLLVYEFVEDTHDLSQSAAQNAQRLTVG